MELKLEERLKALKVERQKTHAQVCAYDGAIQTIEELIKERDKPEPAKEAANG